MTSADDLQQERARQYALCTLALRHNRDGPGVEGIFDQALTNGLAAIVAATWPGQECDGTWTLPASRLLRVIEEHTESADDGVRRVPHPPNRLFDLIRELGDEPPRNFTRVDVPALRTAIAATQRIRHARDTGQDPRPLLTREAVQALGALDHHPALKTILDQFEVDVAGADCAAKERARAYLEVLDEEELERRAAIDYPALYAGGYKDEEVTTVEDCPVCGNFALVAAHRDSTLNEVGIGQCVVCSYERTAAVAQAKAMGLQMQRAAERDD